MKTYSTLQNEKWKQLEDEIGGDLGKNLVLAMKDLYEIYSPEMIDWFAGLYDAKVGGYYYSEAARDNSFVERPDGKFDLLPDAESTYQAISVFYLSGLMAHVDYDKRRAIPEWMQKGIVRFIKSLQDPETGFFYHPQWGKEFTDKYVLRRARDLSWSTSLLADFGSAPTYDAPNGYRGDGIDADGNKVEIKAASADGGETEAKENDAYYPPHLESRETFMKYLLELEEARKGDFYSVGSQLTSESPQFVARDNQLEAAGVDYRLMDVVCDWLNEKQDPETGFFTSINGLLKVSGVYLRAKREIPNAELAVKSAVEFILSPSPARSIVELYNPWNAISNVIGSVRSYGKTVEIDGEMLDGVARADRMRSSVIASAPQTLAKTKEKLTPYAKPKGAFSYTPNGPAITSCAMPVLREQTREGDVNATHLATTGLLSGIYSGLGLSHAKVPIFGEAEYNRYIEILEKNRND